eukprot:SAG31_NODE_284_length_18497_cov_11.811773_12_plen_33_part_00
MRENDVKLDANVCDGGAPNTFWWCILEEELAL